MEKSNIKGFYLMSASLGSIMAWKTNPLNHSYTAVFEQDSY
jgi:hypothetical protein